MTEAQTLPGAKKLAKAKRLAAATFNHNVLLGVQPCVGPSPTKKIARKGIGVLLAVYPNLFAPGENPSDKRLFTVQNTPAFATGHLLADGYSQAVLRICLIKLPAGLTIGDDTQLSLADAAWHNNEGLVEITLSNARAGKLTYRGREGQKLTLPVADFPTGRSGVELSSPNAIVFTAANFIAETKISGSLQQVAAQDFYPSFYVPKATALSYRHEATTGTRLIHAGLKGYDVLKAQWYLRRFGFLQHGMRHIRRAGIDCEWDQIAEIETTGELTPPQEVASKEFQIVSLSSYRNRALANSAITFPGPAQTSISAEAAREMAVWDAAGYKVEPYNGIADLRIAGPSGSGEIIDARIAYGVLHDDRVPTGYLELIDPIGKSNVVTPTARFSVAEQIRSGIRVHDRTELVWSLHNADPLGVLASPYLHPAQVTRVRATLIALRRRQGASYQAPDGLDIQAHSGFRSVAEQDHLYAKGRTAAGEPCKHGNQKRAVGTCPSHPLGISVTNAKGGSSWHNFGLAVDVVFNTKVGDPSWETDNDPRWSVIGAEGQSQMLHWGGNWTKPDTPHLQAAQSKSPSHAEQANYQSTLGSEGQKLAAVWAIVTLQT